MVMVRLVEKEPKKVVVEVAVELQVLAILDH